jgi:hypothetical protein
MAAYAAVALLVVVGLLAYSVTLWRSRLGPVLEPVLPPPWDLAPLAALGALVAAVIGIRLYRTHRRRRVNTEAFTNGTEVAA